MSYKNDLGVLWLIISDFFIKILGINSFFQRYHICLIGSCCANNLSIDLFSTPLFGSIDIFIKPVRYHANGIQDSYEFYS